MMLALCLAKDRPQAAHSEERVLYQATVRQRIYKGTVILALSHESCGCSSYHQQNYYQQILPLAPNYAFLAATLFKGEVSVISKHNNALQPHHQHQHILTRGKECSRITFCRKHAEY